MSLPQSILDSFISTLGECDQEYEFTTVRRFRFDYAWPVWKIAIEYHGGIFAKGRTGHSSISGLLRDYEKLNHAQSLGWIVLQFAPSHIRDLQYISAMVNSAVQAQKSAGRFNQALLSAKIEYAQRNSKRK